MLGAKFFSVISALTLLAVAATGQQPSALGARPSATPSTQRVSSRARPQAESRDLAFSCAAVSLREIATKVKPPAPQPAERAKECSPAQASRAATAQCWESGLLEDSEPASAGDTSAREGVSPNAEQFDNPAIRQSVNPSPASDLPLSHLSAGPHDPLYTTYAAPLARSEYFIDAAYHLNYYSPELGVTYTSQKSGDFALGWRLGKITAFASRDFYKAPVIHRSYTDLVELEYWPFTGIQVRETFDVYSSRLALLEVEVTNHTAQPQNVLAYAYYQNPESVTDAALKDNQLVTFRHHVDPKQWFESPQPKFDPDFNDVFLLSVPPDTWSGHPADGLIPEITTRDFLNGMIYGRLRAFAL